MKRRFKGKRPNVDPGDVCVFSNVYLIKTDGGDVFFPEAGPILITAIWVSKERDIEHEFEGYYLADLRPIKFCLYADSITKRIS